MPETLSPRPRLPEWLRLKLPDTDTFGQTRQLLQDLRLHTVCESARCPNHWECWGKGTATFMIGGDRCTRNCHFCAVTTAKPFPLDPEEPRRVAEATRRMSLRHVVITGVARDDLPDGGAGHFAQTIETVRASNPGIVIEVLVPDFNDHDASIQTVLAARPQVYNSQLETFNPGGGVFTLFGRGINCVSPVAQQPDVKRRISWARIARCRATSARILQRDRNCGPSGRWPRE